MDQILDMIGFCLGQFSKLEWDVEIETDVFVFSYQTRALILMDLISFGLETR
jgi:hypothetical protein